MTARSVSLSAGCPACMQRGGSQHDRASNTGAWAGTGAGSVAEPGARKGCGAGPGAGGWGLRGADSGGNCAVPDSHSPIDTAVNCLRTYAHKLEADRC